MRRVLFYALIFAPVLSQGTLFVDRGYMPGYCYKEYVHIKKFGQFCDIELFPDSKARLSFQLAKCPTEFDGSEWYLILFEVIGGQRQILAKLISIEPQDPYLAATLSRDSGGMGRKLKCPRKR
jgi:hypothetical protein